MLEPLIKQIREKQAELAHELAMHLNLENPCANAIRSGQYQGLDLVLGMIDNILKGDDDI